MTLPERDEIEKFLCDLEGIEEAGVFFEGDTITEIHITAAPGRVGKKIARDVRTGVLNRFGIDVRHQKISVVVRKAHARVAAPPAAGDEAGAREEQTLLKCGNGSTRVLFETVNMLVGALRSEVQVELLYEGERLVGSAHGVPATLGTERLVANATLDALAQIVCDDIRLLCGDIAFTRVGSGDAAIAEVILVRRRSEERLVGACHVGPDRQRSVALAVLDAINRRLVRISPDTWIEHRVGSASEGSEGKENE